MMVVEVQAEVFAMSVKLDAYPLASRKRCTHRALAGAHCPSMLEGEELFTVDRRPIVEIRYVCETENGSTCRRDHWGRGLCNRPCLRASLRAGTACAGPGAFSADRPFRGYRRSGAPHLFLPPPAPPPRLSQTP